MFSVFLGNEYDCLINTSLNAIYERINHLSSFIAVFNITLTDNSEVRIHKL